MNIAQNVANMTVRHRRRFFYFLILTTAAFLSLQLSGISVEDFDNAGQMQENLALPTSRNRPGDAGHGQNFQIPRNTQNNLPINLRHIDNGHSGNNVDNTNREIILQNENTHTNHDRHKLDFGAEQTNKLRLRNLAASSKLQDSIDQNSGQDRSGFAIRQPPAVTNRTLNDSGNATEKTNQLTDEEEVYRLADTYQIVPPAVFQEENCPVCFGTSLCDEFYEGNIKWDQRPIPVEHNKNVQSYSGTWIDEIEDRVLSVTIKQFSNHRMLDNYICQKTSYLTTDKQLSLDEKIKKQCDVSSRVLLMGLASSNVTQMKYVRSEIGKLQYRQNTLFSLPKCASQRMLDMLRTGDHSSDMAMLSTAMILNPHTLVLKFIHDQIPQLSHYFPSYYGECGHTIVQEHESYKPLKKFLPEEWLVRVDLALQVIQMVEDFRTASPDWMVLFGNITYENLAVTKEGQLKMINLQDVMIVDRAEINQTLQVPTPKPKEPCNEECLFDYASSIDKEPDTECGKAEFYSQVMDMLVCNRFLSDLESTKVIRFFDHKGMDYADHPGGLLRDPPYELDLRLTELLYECVFESSPGRRQIVTKTLKKMLHIVKRSKIGSAYW